MLNKQITKKPRVELGIWPTPLCRLKRTEAQLGVNHRLYIKRDDLNGLGAGGNKVRCLEYLLGQALAENCDTIIASGPLQSNMCNLAAAAAAKAGLDCILVFNGPKPDKLIGNQLLNSLLNCQQIYLGNVSPEDRNAYVEELAAQIAAKGKKPYVITNGGANGTGALGYMNIIDELIDQYSPSATSKLTLFVPGGNGGVAAGLIFGNIISGRPFDIVVISVEDSKEILSEHIAAIIKQALEIVGLESPVDIFQNVMVTDEYRGAGWGLDTKLSREEVSNFAQSEGIYIENVYTSKVIVGMKDLLKKAIIKGDACYIHTGGFGSLFSQYE